MLTVEPFDLLGEESSLARILTSVELVMSLAVNVIPADLS